MAYASFRCFVKAPLSTVWQSLRDRVQVVERSGATAKELQSLRLSKVSSLREEIHVDSDRKQITVRLVSGQGLEGERRFRLKSGEESSLSVLDAVLNWNTSSPELDRELMQAAVDILVRDLALQIKQEAEAS